MAQNDDFYIGFLKAPRSHARFVAWIVPLFMIAAAAAGLAWSLAQDDTGSGQWHTDAIVEREGLLELSPYPLLRAERTDKGGIETILLVEGNKAGLTERVKALPGGLVKIRGVEIERNGQRMLSLAPGADSLTSLPADTARMDRLKSPPMKILGTYRLKGEILDSKCYLGVMKPGEGKTHKSCATLCIMGDIPPLFLINHGNGVQSAYLLTDRDGNAIRDAILPFVADPIEVTGEVGWRGDMPVFRINPATITRLAPTGLLPGSANADKTFRSQTNWADNEFPVCNPNRG